MIVRDLVYIPAVMLMASMFLFWLMACQCSKTGFVTWLMINWYPTWVIAQGIRYLACAGKAQGLKSVSISSALVAFYLITIIGLIPELWLAPQKRTTHIVLGFLHGPIYDRLIELDSGVILKRMSHLMVGVLLIMSPILVKMRPWRGLVAIPIVLIITFSSWAGTYKTQSSGPSELKKYLTHSLQGKGFSLHYAPTNKGRSEKTQQLYRSIEFHLAELREILSFDFPHIHIYLYPSRVMKKQLFGGGSTDVTDVVSPSIHITYGSDPHPTLRHELVHAATSSVAFYGLGFHPNMAFTEGLAVALAPRERALTLDESAQSLIQSGRLENLNDLFSPMFWKLSGARAYTVAGSMIDFMIGRYSIDNVIRLYSGDSFWAVFSKDQSEIIDEWREHILEKQSIKSKDLLAEALYRQPGVLHQKCPHSKALLWQTKDDSYYKFRQPIFWNPSKDYMPWLLSLDPQNKDTLLSIWSDELDRIIPYSENLPGRLNTWIRAISNAKNWPPRTIEDIELAILESDLLKITNRTDQSDSILADLKNLTGDKHIGSSLLRQIYARTYLEDELSSNQSLVWRRYLAGWNDQLPALDEGEFWLLKYLSLRRRQPKTIEDLNEMAKTEIPTGAPSTFHVEWYRFLGIRYHRFRSFQQSSDYYKKAAEFASSGAKSYFEELQRRASFFHENPPAQP